MSKRKHADTLPTRNALLKPGKVEVKEVVEPKKPEPKKVSIPEEPVIVPKPVAEKAPEAITPGKVEVKDTKPRKRKTVKPMVDSEEK